MTQSARPIRLRLIDADAETRTLIESLLRNHTGREYVVESDGSSVESVSTSEAQRLVAEALRESEAQLAAVLADRERLERQFYQAQKMETVGQLAGGIAHDFNNILTAIVGFGALIAEQVSGDAEASRNVAEILAAANRASALTRQLLAFGRRQVLHPTRVDLNETVQSLAAMLQQLIGEHIELQIVCEAGLPPIRADLSQLESALANLVVNARDAMPRGGRVTIETAEVVLDDDYSTAHVGVRPGRYARLSVSDSGVGMSHELQARIFEPFFSTKEAGKGTGLGLATVYGIVKQSGGNIWVYSEAGMGATFKVYLPVDEGEGAAEGHREPARGQWSKGTETVLLVEDAPMIRRLAREIMTRAGYSVIEASDGAQASDILARQGRIDVLLTDVVMPRFNGVELAHQLRLARPDLRVLFMSGYPDNAIVRNGLLEDSATFLQKPFTPEELLRKLRAVIDAIPPECAFRDADHGAGDRAE
jgi:signal transduction histidine kinase/ActR/RegA family two-component response regulator